MKKLRCKPGDMAIVVDARYKCNLGAIVQVIELHNGVGDIRYFKKHNAWLAKSSKPLKWVVNGKCYRRKTGPVPDAQLQPIRGYPLGRDIAEGLKEIEDVIIKANKLTRKEKIC